MLRDGMAGILPDAIRLRPDKTNFLPNIWLGLVNDPSGQVLRFANAPPDRLSPYVNMDALREAAQTLLNARTPGEIQPILWLWRAIWLDLWLAERERKRAAPPPAEPAHRRHAVFAVPVAVPVRVPEEGALGGVLVDQPVAVVVDAVAHVDGAGLDHR